MWPEKNNRARQNSSIMCCLPKMHKTPMVQDSKLLQNLHYKPLPDGISKVFKMDFKHVESFRRKSLLYIYFKNLWIVENAFPIIKKLNEIHTKKKAKGISIFDLATLYMTIPYNLLIKVLSKVIDFVFKLKPWSCIGFSKTSICWKSKGYGRRYFPRRCQWDAISFLITKRYFTIGKLVQKQEIGIPTGIDSPPYWANLYIFLNPNTFSNKYLNISTCL